MIIIKGINNLRYPLKGSVSTVGVFDGVHVGHRKILREVAASAKKRGLKSVVMTFYPHPVKILNPGSKIPSLISLDHRIKLIEDCGIDILIIVKFTLFFAAVSAESFARSVLLKKLGTRYFYVGKNFYFGRKGKAGEKELIAIAKRLGFGVRVLSPVKISGNVVSSSIIRRLIIDGDLKNAARLLGRPVSILGTVVRGARIARVLGYPTANINPHHEVVPKVGVYAVKVKVGRQFYKGVLNIGFRPTFFSSRDKEPEIEVHIFGFHKRIYGRDIEIFFVKKLRVERRFSNTKKLVEQIKKDALMAQSL